MRPSVTIYGTNAKSRTTSVSLPLSSGQRISAQQWKEILRDLGGYPEYIISEGKAKRVKAPRRTMTKKGLCERPRPNDVAYLRAKAHRGVANKITTSYALEWTP